MPQIIETGRWNDNLLTLYDNGTLTVTPMSAEEIQADPQPLSFYDQPLSQCMPNQPVDSIVFKPGSVCRHTTSLNHMFEQLFIRSIDAEHLNVSSVTTMDHMFYNCYALQSVKFPKQPAFQLTSAKKMFANCHSLKSIDFTGWSTPHLEYMDGMFSNCSTLTSANLSSLFPEKMETIQPLSTKQMFQNCRSLQTLTMFQGSFNISNCSKMFQECKSLKALDLSSLFITNLKAPEPLSAEQMFQNCTSLQTLTMFHGTIDFSNCNEMFKNCIDLRTLDLSNIHVQSQHPEQRSASISAEQMFCDCSNLISLLFFSTEYLILNSTGSMFCYCTELSAVSLQNCSVQSNIIDNMFLNCHSLSSFTINQAGFFKSAYRTFDNCSALKDLNLSLWTVQPYTDSDSSKKNNNFDDMFNKCENLESIDLFAGTITDASCDNMFQDCKSLQNINLSAIQIITDSHLSCSYMFCGCNLVQQIRFFQSAHHYLKSVRSMFFACHKLSFIDIPNSTIQSLNIDYMFYNCKNLKNIYIPGFHTFSDASGTFSGCIRLEQLDLSNWSVYPREHDFYQYNKEYNNFDYMFSECHNLKSLKFIKGKITNLDTTCMFDNCLNLNNIDLSSIQTFNQSRIIGKKMFYNCKALQSVQLMDLHHLPIKSLKSAFSNCDQLSQINLFHNIKPAHYLETGLTPTTILHCSQTAKDNMTAPYSQFKELLNNPSCHTIIPLLLEHYTLTTQQINRIKDLILSENIKMNIEDKAACMNLLYKKQKNNAAA